MTKEHFWKKFLDWDEAEASWDEGAKNARREHPLKVLKELPQMPGISEETARNLKWKSLKWMVAKDENWRIAKYILKRPVSYTIRYLKSLISKKSYNRENDFYFYGIQGVHEFKELLKNPNALFVVGFSYCHKPFECPKGRFTPDCIHDPENPVCRQCFIGKSINTLPDQRSIPLLIPTIHYIGEKIFEIIEANPGKEVVFLITACEMTLEMFGDWGNMAGIKGIGVRLDGRICNTMKAFELSEQGIKPGLTVVLEDTQKKMLDIFSHWRTLSS